jgi:hypothetical protein
VKQRSPLSPTLFNLCIDPLLRRLNIFKEKCGYTFDQYTKEEHNAVQAYADRILLFSWSREDLEFELNLVSEFVEFTKIELNSGKCNAFKNGK